MKKLLLFVLALPLSSCVRRAHPVALEEDLSIVFPHFFGQDAVEVGSRDGGTYELDGATLRALTLAANDFLPPDAKNPSCWDKQESHRYRVIRQEEVIFIRIDEDPGACGRVPPALHSGASYAISPQGRILRRLLDGQPEAPLPPSSHGDEDAGVLAAPGVIPQAGEARSESQHSVPAPGSDRGTVPTTPAPPTGLDGGLERP
ncbi:hypothetical protein ACLESO_44280 [Pyxidicoccus sp. 3LG]